MNNYIMLKGHKIDLTEEQINTLESVFSQTKPAVTVQDDIVKIGDIEFIMFPEVNGAVPIVAKDVAFTTSFGANNNLKESTELLAKLDEFLQKVISVVGEDNVLEFETDLTALDGTDDYRNISSKVSLYTLDFYRHNRKIFDKYKVDSYCWIATPDSTQNNLVLCVSPGGRIVHNCCSRNGGVRPFLYLKSNIFVSE